MLTHLFALLLTLDPNSDGARAFRQGDFSTAERLFRHALSTPRPPLARSRVTSNLAATLRHLGRLNEAERYARLTVELRSAALGAGHAETGVALNNLAQLHDLLGRATEAEIEYRAALRSTANSSTDSAIVWNNLGELLRTQGRFTEARRALSHSLALKRILHAGAPHEQIAITLNNLARLAEDEGHPEQSLELWHQALEIAGSHRTIVSTHLARLYLRLGDSLAAQQCLAEAQRAAFGLDPLTESALLHVSSQLALHCNAPARALAAIAKAIALREKHLGSEHASLAPLLQDQFHVLLALDRTREAKRVEARLVRIARNQPLAPAIDVRTLAAMQ